jgi:hypothetical protein
MSDEPNEIPSVAPYALSRPLTPTESLVERALANGLDPGQLYRRHVDPLLHELGLTLSYGTENVGSETYATVKLTHEGGHTEEARLPFRAAKPPGASNDAQAIGAGQTYAMRYLTTAILGLWFVDRDTDAVPGATVIDGPLVSDVDAHAIQDAIIAAAERTGHGAETIKARILKAHGAGLISELPAHTVQGILERLEGMVPK